MTQKDPLLFESGEKAANGYKRLYTSCLMPFVQPPGDLLEQLFYQSPVGLYYSDDGQSQNTGCIVKKGVTVHNGKLFDRDM